jgi:golgi-specific brefeldin A-resistance guanine nucleotide exchange factor 1
MNSKGRTINSIKGEIHNLLAVLRFLPSSCPEVYINELLDLFQKLLVCSDVDSVDFWTPFLKIIQGPDASSSIKGVALSSIHKFLLYGFLSPTSAYTLNKIVNSVVQCIINSFSSNDEVVLMKLLHVFLECLRTQASVYLTDASVWSIAKRCFDIFERDRVTELLKKTAQNTLLQIFLIVFGRVSVIQTDNNESGYGVVCLKKILLHLAYLIGYSDKTDAGFKEKRCLGLFLINTALETAGENIGLHDQLINIIQDEVCKSLLLNSATDDLFILSLTLRVVFNLFQSVKQHLKVQQEVFFNSFHLKIASAYEESSDQLVYQRSELALESIVDFCREPSLILELYTNYDCDVDFANLFERLAKFLCKHAFPLHQNLNRLNELCLEGLLAIITSISMRCDSSLIPTESMQDLREKKTMKEIFFKSAEIFNSDQKEFIPKLKELNYLPKDCDELDIAKFFKENPAIDHEKLGEYLSKNNEFNIKVLEVNFI